VRGRPDERRLLWLLVEVAADREETTRRDPREDALARLAGADEHCD
jgi:hypothetical protein